MLTFAFSAKIIAGYTTTSGNAEKSTATRPAALTTAADGSYE